MRDDFPLFRASLAAEYSDSSHAELNRIAEAIYGPGADAESVENFFGNIGHGLQQAAGAVGHFAKQALPGVIQGATAGSALGPWGALAGAVAGGAGSILSHSDNPTARAIGGGLNTVTGLASTVRGGGPMGAMGALGALGGGAVQGARLPAPAGGASGGSANALMAMLGRPELLNGLLGGALGQFGRQSIPVGGQKVPTSLILNALGTLANRAAHEAAELEASESLPGEFIAASESLGLDAQDAEGRTDTLLTLLALQPMLWGNRPPVVVSQTTPSPAPPTPAYPPVPVAGPEPSRETVWIADSAEDYRDMESWESGTNWEAAYA